MTVGLDSTLPWYGRQLAAVPEGRRRALLVVIHRPETALAPAAAVVAGGLSAFFKDGDAPQLRAAGVRLLGTSGLNVFADAWLQIGPIYLVVLGAIERLLRPVAGPAVIAVVTSSAMAAVMTLLAIRAAARAARSRGTSVVAASWAVGVVVAFGLGDFLLQAVQYGHPEEPLLGVLLVEAALLAGSGRHRWAGLLLGLAVGVKQWAVIGGGALLLARRPRQRLIGIAIALAVTAACYLPFYLFGTVSTYGYSWGWGKETAFGWFSVTLGLTGWTARGLQGALAGLAGVLVAWRRPGSPVLVAMAGIGVRVALDPYHLPYYLAPWVIVVLIWAWSCPTLTSKARLAVCGAVVAVGYAMEWVPVVFFWNGLSLGVAAVLLWAVRVDRGGAVPPELAGGGLITAGSLP